MWVYDPSALSSLSRPPKDRSVATPKQETSLDYLAEDIAERGHRLASTRSLLLKRRSQS